MRGIELRSNDDLADLEPEIRQHLESLCNMFFAGDQVQIRQMTCCYVSLNGKSDYNQSLRHLNEIRLLLGYLYSSPSHIGDVFLPAESSSLFTFRPDRVASLLAMNTLCVGERAALLVDRPEPEHGYLEGYEGLRNLTAYLCVAEGSRIYPEIPNQILNNSQSVIRNLGEFLQHPHNWAFQYLFFGEREPENSDEVRKRIFDGLEWYLRSCRKAIFESEALVHLAIALESLLRVPSGRDLTERFKDAVLTLIGPVPRLDSWLEQFYAARSKAVHEGVPHELAFLTVDKELAKKAKRGDKEVYPHRSLIEYGRRIFRLCLTTILSSAENVAASGLEKLFIHNAERISQIREILSNKKTPASERLKKAYGPICDLAQFHNIMGEPYIELKTLLQVAYHLLKVFKETNPTLPNDAREAIDRFLAEDSQTLKNSQRIDAMESISITLNEINAAQERLHYVVIGFLHFATDSTFKLRCLLEEHPKPEARTDNSV